MSVNPSVTVSSLNSNTHEPRERERDLDGIVGANVILVNGLQPTNIVVSVRNQMDIKLSGDYALRSIVCDEIGFRT